MSYYPTTAMQATSPNLAVTEEGMGYTFRETAEYQNSVAFHSAGEEMLRCGPEGFYVRGKKVEQDDKEARAVYNAFKEWLVWAQLNRG
jgi:hypothetical protein